MARLTVFLLLASLPSSIFANEFSLSARDTTSSQTTLSAPETLFVPINFDARNRRYTVKVSLPNGSSPDLASYNFALTTSTGYSSVTGNECSTCEASPTFSIPSSAQPESQQIISLPEGDFVGPTITQTFNLELQNGSVWSWIDQSFIVANQSNSVFSPNISGIMGLGTNSREGRFNVTPMAYWLNLNPGQQNFSFGLALNIPSSTSSNGGTLHWTAPDKNSYQGDIAWKPLIPFSSLSSSSANTTGNTSSINADSFVEMDSWVFQGSNSVNVSDGAGNLLVVVDPSFMDLVFPQSQARSIYDAIPGSSRQVSLGTSAAYSLPCDSKMSLTLTFGTVSVTLTETQLVQQIGNSTCLGILEEWADESVTAYLLGASLISNIYLIFQGSESNSSFGFADRSSTPSSNGVAIAAVVLGSLALLNMIIISAVFLIRWRRRRLLKKVRIEPFTGVDRSSLLHLTPTPSNQSSNESDRFAHYILAPTGLVPVPQNENNVINNARAGNRNHNGGTKRAMRMSAERQQQMLNVTTPTALSASNSNVLLSPTSHHSHGRQNNPLGLFVQIVSPVSTNQFQGPYTIVQNDLETESVPLLGAVDQQRSAHSRNDSARSVTTSLPPYLLTDPDPQASARNRASENHATR